jgi:hypothetical protein
MTDRVVQQMQTTAPQRAQHRPRMFRDGCDGGVFETSLTPSWIDYWLKRYTRPSKGVGFRFEGYWVSVRNADHGIVLAMSRRRFAIVKTFALMQIEPIAGGTRLRMTVVPIPTSRMSLRSTALVMLASIPVGALIVWLTLATGIHQFVWLAIPLILGVIYGRFLEARLWGPGDTTYEREQIDRMRQLIATIVDARPVHQN